MKTQLPESAKVIPGPGGSPLTGNDRSIGALLIDAGKITAEDAEKILRHAKERSMRFGDAAVALRLVGDDDIRQVLARQFDYPYLLPGQSSVSAEVVAALAPFSPQVEALRAIRSQLLLRWFTGEPEKRALAVVSPGRGEGRSHLAANLAVVFSQMGERTLLIDADLRNPRQHQLFGLRNSTGLSTTLAERSGPEAVQRIQAFVDLSVLVAGPIPPNPLELLGRPAFGTLMAEVAAHYDVVILDTPSAALGSDFQLVAQKAKGVLVVGRQHRTEVLAAQDVATEVAASGAAIVGGVFNQH